MSRKFSRTRRALLAAAVVVSLSLFGGALNASSVAAQETSTSSSAMLSLHAKAKQRAVLRMHPQIVQPGTVVRSASKARSSMTGAFRPIRKGRVAMLQRKKGTGWVTVARGKQNGRGEVEFTAPYKANGSVLTYRVLAPAGGGLGKIASKGVRTDKWGRADWTDEFAGTVLGADWNHRMQIYSAASLRQCSKGDRRAVKVKNGAVHLSVLNDPDRPTGPLDTSPKCRYDGRNYEWRLNGHIGTQESGRDFRYGYAAARVKFQPRRGQHGSFWLQPTTTASPEGSAKLTGAEIDVIEWFGNNHPNGGLSSFIWHYPDDGKEGKTGVKVGGFIKNPGRFGKDWHQRYHVFSVEWTPKRYIFRIDGKETFRTNKGVSGQRQFLVLSLLSSDYELQYLDGEDKLPQTMAVDWVRYWER
jgi:hypothetical protein